MAPSIKFKAHHHNTAPFSPKLEQKIAKSIESRARPCVCDGHHVKQNKEEEGQISSPCVARIEQHLIDDTISKINFSELPILYHIPDFFGAVLFFQQVKILLDHRGSFFFFFFSAVFQNRQKIKQ
jgi:hypothetical protein